MKPKGMAKQPEQNLSSQSRGTLTDSGLDLETQIFSASGRGRGFFLTSLFIELIDSTHDLGHTPLPFRLFSSRVGSYIITGEERGTASA
jgi:hypothetical protein